MVRVIHESMLEEVLPAMLDLPEHARDTQGNAVESFSNASVVGLGALALVHGRTLLKTGEIGAKWAVNREGRLHNRVDVPEITLTLDGHSLPAVHTISRPRNRSRIEELFSPSSEV